MKNTLITCRTDSSSHPHHGLPSAAVGVVVLFPRWPYSETETIKRSQTFGRKNAAFTPRIPHGQSIGPSRCVACTHFIRIFAQVNKASERCIRSSVRRPVELGPRPTRLRCGNHINDKNKNDELFPCYLRVRPLLHCLSHPAACGVFPIDVERST